MPTGKRKELPRREDGRIIIDKPESVKKMNLLDLDENLDYFLSSYSSLVKEISKEVLDVDISIIRKIINTFLDKVKQRVDAGFTVKLLPLGVIGVYHYPGGYKRKPFGREALSYPCRKLYFRFSSKIRIQNQYDNKQLKYKAKGLTPEMMEERRRKVMEFYRRKREAAAAEQNKSKE